MVVNSSSVSQKSRQISLLLTIPEDWSPEDGAFKAEVEKFVLHMNKLITIYNTTESEERGVAILKEMSVLMQKIEHKFPASYYEGLDFYSKLSSDLFRVIKNQRSVLGKQSMLDADLGLASELIANMSPDKLNEFAKILTGKDDLKTDLRKLYPDDYQPAEEKEQFTKFMYTHSIEVLGGFNSRNFKIIPQNGKAEVLKLDNRLNSPTDIEDSLREKKFTGLALVKIDRPISCRVIQTHDALPGQEFPQLLSSIQVTEYCEDGSILEYSKKQKDKGDVELCLLACLVIEKMGEKLSELNNNNVIMFDFKPANWLSKNGKLLLADTKSFMRCHDDRFDPLFPENKYYAVMRSPQFFFPEDTGEKMEFSVSAFNSYVLGLNLHCLLRGGEKFPYYARGTQNVGYLSDEVLNASGPDSEIFMLDYVGPQYLSDEYEPLITLVGRLTKYSPEDRLSIEKALDELQLIIKPKLLLAQKQKFQSEFKKYGLTNYDDNITLYLANKFATDNTETLLNNLESVNQLIKYLDENLDEQQALNELYKDQLVDDKYKDVLKTIFKEYLESSPDDRKTILTEMKKLHELYVSCKDFEFGDNDTKMRDFTNTKLQDYTDKPDQRPVIIKELNNLIVMMNKHGIMYLRSIAADLRGQNNYFHIS